MGNTLLSCDPPVARVYARSFARHGLAAPDDEVRRALGATWSEVARAFLSGEERWGGPGGEEGFWRRFVSAVFRRSGGGELPDGLLEELVAHFADERNWAVFPEVEESLRALKARGLRLSVVSNWDSTLPSLLSRLGLDRHFDEVVVSALVGASKPGPAIFEEALRRAGVAPGEALHVGDSLLEDYHGARAAGLLSLLLDRDGTAPEGVESIPSLASLAGRLDGAARPGLCP